MIDERPPTPPRGAWEGTARYLGLTPDHLLCHLHEPEAAVQRPTTVVFCGPFGWDDMTSYRARRHWAQQLALSGYPAVRFDLPTTGDSGGDPTAPQRLATWLTATAQVIDWARERTECERLAVFGLGLGGLLAWQVVNDGAPVQDLLLWGVPANGRALVREQRAYAELVAAGYAPQHQQARAGDGQDEELIGYLITAETQAELRKLAPAKAPPPSGLERVLLLGRDELPIPTAQVDFFTQAGAEVHAEETGDFDALYALPALAQRPSATIERTLAWLGERDEPGDGAGRADGAGSPHGPTAREQTSVEIVHDGTRMREELVTIEIDGYEIAGVLTTPVDAPPQATALLLSAGALRRTGLSRTWVELARRWAGLGVASLRFDQPGIGDSSGDERELVTNTALYAPESTQIALGAIEWLAGRGLPQRYVTVGSCSGAYWALHAALADARIVSTMMIGLYAFEWSEALVAERATAQALGALRSRLWRRLIRGGITLAEVRRKLRAITPQRLRGRLVASAEGRQTRLVSDGLAVLRDRRTDAVFVLFEGQVLLRQFEREGYLEAGDRWPDVSFDLMPSPDNLFRALPLQGELHAALDTALERVLGGDSAANAVPAPVLRPPRRLP